MRLQRAAPQLIDMAILCNKSNAESASIKSLAAKVSEQRLGMIESQRFP
jgi:hypothetical protein